MVTIVNFILYAFYYNFFKLGNNLNDFNHSIVMRVKLDNTDESPCHTTWHIVDDEQMFFDMTISVVLVESNN